MRVSSRSGGWVCAFVILLLAGVTPVRAGHEQTIFFHNFDSSTVGALPDAWEVVFSGAGVAQQKVSDEFALSGNRSLKLVGKEGAVALMERVFTNSAPVVGASYYVMISATGKGFTDNSGLFCLKAEDTLGTWYGGVQFNHANNKILAGQMTLGDWTPGVWYHVRIVTDRADHRAKVWIDGVFKGDLVLESLHPELLNAIGLVAGEAGVPVFYDNVRVFLPSVQEMGALLLEKLGLLVDRGELSPAIANELSQSVLRGMANEEAGRLVVARTNLNTFRTKVANYARPGTPITDHPPVIMMKDYIHMTRLADQMILQFSKDIE